MYFRDRLAHHFFPLATTFAILLFLPISGKGAPIVNDSPRPTIKVPKATLKPATTADLDDPAWAHAASLPPLTRSLGHEPMPPSFPDTTILLLWDADYLYVRFICKDREIYTPIHGHDSPIYKGDAVEVFIDPVGDARQWIELEFNADNDVLDKIYLCTTQPKVDASLCMTQDVASRDFWEFLSWDMTGLLSKARRLPPTSNAQDWIVDIAVPAKELLRRKGLKQFQPMTLKGDFLRYKWMPSARGSERDLLPLNWSPVSFGNPPYSPAAYGTIILTD
jgi:hypothetical protein